MPLYIIMIPDLKFLLYAEDIVNLSYGNKNYYL